MTKEEKEFLGQIKSIPHGKVLMKYLEGELADLKDITKSKSWEETQGRQLAVKIIEKLFSFMEEKEVRKSKKNQYV